MNHTKTDADKDDEQQKPKIAAIYARVSSGRQVKGYSLDEQINLCRQRCEQNGWKVRFIFREDGVNASSTNRTKFKAMMKQAKEKKFDVIIFWKLDRFARSLHDTVTIEKKLREWGINICSITESIDTTTSNGRFVFRTLASASEWERDMISERSKMGMQALASEHRWPNRIIPYGYKKDEHGYLSVNRYEAEIVKKIFKRYIQLRSMPQLAFELNEKGIKPRRAKQWSATVVKYVLDNLLYTGRYEVAGVSDFIPELRIISKKLFEKAKKVRYRNKKKSIPATRKEHMVDKLINGYKLFLDDMEKVETQDNPAIYGE